MCAYAPSRRSRATFLVAFPHALEFGGGEFLVGSNEPIEIDVPAWLDRLRSVTAYLGPAISADVSASLESARSVERKEPALAEINSDLFPRDEFLVP